PGLGARGWLARRPQADHRAQLRGPAAAAVDRARGQAARAAAGRSDRQRSPSSRADQAHAHGHRRRRLRPQSRARRADARPPAAWRWAMSKPTPASRQTQWQRHFGLNASPFSKDVDDDNLWMPSSKQALVDELVEAIEGREHVLLAGENGTGKTCTLRALRRRLPETDYRLTYCHNATLGRRDFYRQLCIALGLSPKATAAAVFHSVSSHVEELGRQRVHPVFLLDEAHLLQQQVLEHLHVLANYQWDQKPLVSLVLVGLPELWSMLALRKNRSLWSRIHCRLSIEAPSVADTTEYVEHR